MYKYLFNKLVQSVIALLGITLIVFIMLNVVGDPVTLMVSETASLEEMEEVRMQLGLDENIMIQYFKFLMNMFRGDFGMSYYYKEPALGIVLERIPATFILAFTGFILIVIIGMFFGVLAAVFKDSWIDYVIRWLTILIQSVPNFWFGIIAIIIFSVELKWLPTGGSESWKSIILPSITLALPSLASTTRILRANMIDVLSKEYIEVAYSKGLSRTKVIISHALKNGISSTITILGMQFASLIGGAVIIETIYSWPGVGRLLIQSIRNSDFMVVEVIVILLAVSFLTVNLIVDIMYYLINPRVRL